MIATVDIAENAAHHLLSRDFTGRTVETILDPEDVSMNEATRALGAALGIPDLPYIEFPPVGGFPDGDVAPVSAARSSASRDLVGSCPRR